MDQSAQVNFLAELQKYISLDAAELVSKLAKPLRHCSREYFNYWLFEDKEYKRLQLLASIRFYYSVRCWNQFVGSKKVGIKELKQLKKIRTYSYYATFQISDKLLTVYHANFHSPCFWDYQISLNYNYSADLPYRKQRRARRKRRTFV